MSMEWIDALFHPRKIALIGASNQPGKVGHVIMRNLMDETAGYKGEIIPVHPTEETIQGIKAEKNVCDADSGIGLAIIVTPPDSVLPVLKDCALANIRAVVIITGGFAELGEEGEKLQSRITNLARSENMRLIGPNCFGVINTASGLNASIGLGLPGPGVISLVTQSGSYGMAAFSQSDDMFAGFSKVIALGNKADLDETDFLLALGSDPDTKVIAFFLESIKNGRAFYEAALNITPRKPVIVLKAGRGTAAQRAAGSHTAALTSDRVITDAALKQSGVIMVRDGRTLLNAAAALSNQSGLIGNRIGIITNSGGTGVELTDLLEEFGLEVPELSKPLQANIQNYIPAQGSATNPIDVTTQWPRFEEMYGKCLRELLESNEVDAVMPILLQRSALMPEVTNRIIKAVHEAREKGNEKPVHICWVAPDGANQNRKALMSAGIPCHQWAAQAARVLSATQMRAVNPAPDINAQRWKSAPESAPGWLKTDDAMALLKENGFQPAEWRIAVTPDEAVGAAGELGYPVVVKVEQADMLHKSDRGGVVLGCQNGMDVRGAFDQFDKTIGQGPVLVQKQSPPGIELFFGGRRDENFGAVITFGLGGIWVEALNDTALRLAPFGCKEASSMLKDLRGAQILDGFRGKPGLERKILEKMISDLSIWFAVNREVVEFDINPAIAIGENITIVDARIRIGENRNTTDSLAAQSPGETDQTFNQNTQH